MTKANILFLTLISFLSFSFSFQNKENSPVHFDAIYVAKTGEIDIPGNKIEIFNYIRFYEDGSVYTQAANSYDPVSVSKWFGKDGRFERSGTYEINKNDISFTVSNSNSPDIQLEGARSDHYTGKIITENKLSLTITYPSGEKKKVTFESVKVDE